MAIIAVKAWYLEAYEPIRELEKRPHDLRLSKSSLLKSGFRADFLDESSEVPPVGVGFSAIWMANRWPFISRAAAATPFLILIW